jgi:cytochrome c-type biogenesis protein CcmH/NrfF
VGRAEGFCFALTWFAPITATLVIDVIWAVAARRATTNQTVVPEDGRIVVFKWK